ncbi:hypothetical protein JOD54_004474 [Actinokineospora baliensis]|uniref:hypothetical protein n=1 Tax=Actinokineospora baliensis TaxID=547056 RepID=UPI0019590C23|nr:hypothetical protein [Actinokineospora baliensis]MBM7774270.1 hypothetical protein [Actinokineospora baliensis]
MRSRRALVYLSCLLVLVVAGIITIRLAQGDDAPAEAARSQGESACSARKTREHCDEVQLDGHSWRYTYRPAEKATADTVLLDFGGPGLSALSGSLGLAPFLEAYPQLSKRYNFLVIEEPWVTRDLPDGCDAAMTEYYLAYRNSTGGGAATSKSMVDKCELRGTGWGFDRESYGRLTKAIAQKHGSVLKGFIGHSWGAVRLAYLGKDAPDWSILIRPFPVGVDNETLVQTRSQLTAALYPAVAQLTRSRIDTRSLEVTQFDQASAIVDLGYMPGEYLAAESAGVRDGSGLAQIGKLSDALWGRYGTDSISPSTLAQFQEICAVAGPVPAQPVTITTSADALAARFAPCAGFTKNGLTAAISPTTCVVTSKYDSVAPESLAKSTYGTLPGNVKFVDTDEKSHSSFAGIDPCLTHVGAAG